MDMRTKRIFIISSIVFALGIIAVVVFYFLTPKLPSTQNSDKTVIIDNYAKYTRYISSDSFGTLGNNLYRFIDKPSQGVYHAAIVEETYTYAQDSWFSEFTVKLKDSDISWDIRMQTVNNGDINGDVSITCASGATCLSLSDTMNSRTELQDYLPLNADEYVIAYQKKDNTLSVVYYDQDGLGKTKALEKIRSLGFKPENYTIEYYYGGH